MTRRERLMATLQGGTVDRPAVSFYEIGGFKIDADDPDPFNIYNDPSWQPLLRLADEETDLIRLCAPTLTAASDNPRNEFITTQEYVENGSRFVSTQIRIGRKVLTSLTRRDPGLNTIWTLEHLLKDVDDLKSYLELPLEVFASEADVRDLIEEDKALGDRGIVMVDTADPLCLAAGLFSMEDYTVIAFSEQELFNALLEKLSVNLYRTTEAVAGAFPGHLWRIYGPEYASEPYLPVNLFRDYVVRYTKPMVEIVKKRGGFARIHCHGRIRNILSYIVQMGADCIDPVEPPPHGDMELAEIRRAHGAELVIFGNLEVCDIENMEPSCFEKVVSKSIRDGVSGSGRGFVLMPSAAPYGRTISARTMANYETVVRLVKGSM